LRPIAADQDPAIRSIPPSQSLLEFSSNKSPPGQRPDTLETLLRDRVPPLEDLVLGAVPGAIGVTSAMSVIIGGLFLLYRGLIDFRIPLLITATAWIALMVLPLPGVVASTPNWSWLPEHVKGVGWAVGITFANYEVLGSPLLFTAFFLAGSPTVRPMGRGARTVYAVMIGLLTAVFQLYLSVSLGSYLALLVTGMATPLLDRKLAARPLV
jgi:electron transport complex protein RnfD